MPRDYPERPIIGVAAVLLENDRVTLVRRGRAPAYGEWSLPGGAVELGETLESAVALLDRIFWDKGGQIQFHYVLLDFLCRKIGGELLASSDAISCAQAPLFSLDEYKLTKETREVIDRAYQRLNGGSPPIYKVRTSIRL